MNKRQKILAIIAALIILMAGAAIYLLNLPNDRCTSNDREINNCVPAGKCGPTPSIDAVTDCDPKKYDKKYNSEF